jgi:ABC-type sugar transport system substrate-binding protein
MLKRLLFGLSLTFLTTGAYAEPAKPDFFSDKDWANVKNLVDVDRVKWNAYDPKLAKKKDGSPYRILDVAVWTGDDYQVVAHHLLKAQLESAGAQVTLINTDHAAEAMTRAFDDAIATHSYDAIVAQPIDPEALASVVDRATAAGIDVFNWVSKAETDQVTGWVRYLPDRLDTNGQIGAKIVELAKQAGATPDKPYEVLELWGTRAEQTVVDRHNGFVKGLNNDPSIKVIESADTLGQPEALIKAIQDGFAANPDIKAVYPHFGDAGAIAEGLRSVGKLFPKSDPKHVVVVLQDIDKSMLNYLKEGTFDYTVSNNPWQQIDVLTKQLLWKTVLKQPLNDGDAFSGKVVRPRGVNLPMPFLSGDDIQTKKAQLFGGTVAFTDMPLGKWELWPTLDTTEIGLPIPTIEDRKKLLDY